MNVLVDSNILLDILTEDPMWCDCSSDALVAAAEKSQLCINPVIYSEVSVGFDRIEDLDAVLARTDFQRCALPYEAGFLAGKCFLSYRKRGGTRRSPLPDFYIGAHAAVSDMALLTRDLNRYKTYFPKLQLISPPA